MKRHLTDLSVQRFKVPKQGQIEVFDLGYPGLALRIGNGGAKTFVVFHRYGGKLNRLTLGRWPEVSLGAARDGWRRTREAIARGEDPAAKNGKASCRQSETPAIFGFSPAHQGEKGSIGAQVQQNSWHNLGVRKAQCGLLPPRTGGS